MRTYPDAWESYNGGLFYSKVAESPLQPVANELFTLDSVLMEKTLILANNRSRFNL